MVFVKKTVLLFQHLFFTLLPNVGMWPILFYFATHCELMTNHVLLCYPMWVCDQSCFFATQCEHVTNYIYIFLLPNAGMWPIMFYYFVFPLFFFFHVRTFLEWPNLVHKLISKGEINISETGLHSLLVALG